VCSDSDRAPLGEARAKLGRRGKAAGASGPGKGHEAEPRDSVRMPDGGELYSPILVQVGDDARAGLGLVPQVVRALLAVVAFVDLVV